MIGCGGIDFQLSVSAFSGSASLQCKANWRPGYMCDTSRCPGHIQKGYTGTDIHLQIPVPSQHVTAKVRNVI